MLIVTEQGIRRVCTRDDFVIDDQDEFEPEPVQQRVEDKLMRCAVDISELIKIGDE